MATLSSWPEGAGGVILATLLGSTVGESLELVFAMVTSRLRGNKASFSARTLAPLLATAVCFYAPVVALLTLAYTEVSPWTAPLFIAPALAAQKLFAMYLQQRTLASDLTGANESLNRSNLEFAEALVATLEQSDLYTAGHSKAVAIYSRDIAERMGLPAGCSGARLSLRPCSRHRQGRAASESSVEGWAAHTRGATRDAAPLRNRREHPGAR